MQASVFKLDDCRKAPPRMPRDLYQDALDEAERDRVRLITGVVRAAFLGATLWMAFGLAVFRLVLK